jgi:hypothetical protein
MITSELAQMIRKELEDIRKITDSFEGKNGIHELEIELCLRKTRNLYDELILLKEQIRKATPSYGETEVSEPKKNDPVEIPPAEPFTGHPSPEPPSNLLKDKKTDTIELEPSPSPSMKVSKNIPVRESKPSPVTVTDETDVNKGIVQNNPAVKQSPKSESTDPVVLKSQIPDHAIVSTPSVAPEKPQPHTKEKKDVQASNSAKTHPKRVADEIGIDKKLLYDNLIQQTRESDLVTRFKTTPIADLTKAIPLNDRIWFTKELFAGEGDELAATLEKLNQMNDLDEALQHLSGQFNWNPDDKVVQKFLQIISRKFS